MNKIALAILSIALAVPCSANDILIPPPNRTIRQISAAELDGLKAAMQALVQIPQAQDGRGERAGTHYAGYLYAYGPASASPIFFPNSETLEEHMRAVVPQDQREAAAYQTSAINLSTELRPDGSQAVKSLSIGSYWGYRAGIKADGAVVYTDIRQLTPQTQRVIGEAIARFGAWGRAQAK